MARIPRLLIDGESAAYYGISRTALSGYPLGDVEKDHLVQLMKRLSRVYFAEILGFAVLGNHWHLLVRMHPGGAYSDDEIRRRFRVYYGADTKRQLLDGQILSYRAKWENLPEFVRELKQTFSRGNLQTVARERHHPQQPGAAPRGAIYIEGQPMERMKRIIDRDFRDEGIPPEVAASHMST